MSELARAILELAERPWATLTADERDAFGRWLAPPSRGEDLYLLLRFARRQWRTRRASSSTTVLAVQRALDVEELE